MCRRFGLTCPRIIPDDTQMEVSVCPEPIVNTYLTDDGSEYEDTYNRYVPTFQVNPPPHHPWWYSDRSSSLSRADSKYLTDQTASHFSVIYRCTRESFKYPNSVWLCHGKLNACRVSVSLTRCTSVADELPMYCGVRCPAIWCSQQCCSVYFVC